MRIFEWFIVALILAAPPVAQPALAFEGTPVGPQDTAIPVVAAQPGAAAALKKAMPPSATKALATIAACGADGLSSAWELAIRLKYSKARRSSWATPSPSAYIRPSFHCATG